MSIFSKVIYDANQPEIAKVNRLNNTLYLNPSIWKGLPADQQEFVLLHEKGHLELQTADEFNANLYAVGKFAPVRTLTNSELAQRIVVMREILTPQQSVENGFSEDLMAGAISSTSGLIQSITNVLPVLGVGSKSRQAEVTATASANLAIIEAQSKADAKKTNSYIIFGVLAGVILIVIITLYFILKK